MAKADAWVELGAGVHVLYGGVNCALVETEGGGALIVDSGADKDHGRRIRKKLDELARAPVALLCSHSHADHIGGNAYLQGVYPDLPTYAPAIEAELIRAPYLESVYLFHGAKPLAELTGKWLMAPASRVDHVVAPGAFEVDGSRFELIDVSGHSHRQLAVLAGDVLLAADALFGPETLERYPLPFAQDVAGQLRSCDVVAGTAARVVVPGHGQATERPAELAASNAAAVRRASEAVAAACQGVGTESVAAQACRTLAIEISDLPRYHLNLCAVSAHLGHLRDSGRVRAELRSGALVWEADDRS